jgi:hypothetical protein
LGVFRKFLIVPGQMLCFNGPNLAKHRAALAELTEKGFLVKEQFSGAYSLTQAGFAAMNACEESLQQQTAGQA